MLDGMNSSFAATGSLESAKRVELANDMLHNLKYYSVPTLAHLVALLSGLSSPTHPCNAKLVVVDSLATLVDLTYSRVYADGHQTARKTDGNKVGSERRQGAIADISAKLVRVATVANLAMVVTNYVVTKIRSELEAILRPALSGVEWENALVARVELFRDWTEAQDQLDQHVVEQHPAARFARVIKAAGVARQQIRHTSSTVTFTIGKV